MAASTGTTAQAVVFIAQATPSATPARASLPRPAQASTRQVSAMIGGSGTPPADGDAVSGGGRATPVRARWLRHRIGRAVGSRGDDSPAAWPMETRDYVGQPETEPVRRDHAERRGDKHHGG